MQPYCSQIYRWTCVNYAYHAKLSTHHCMLWHALHKLPFHCTELYGQYFTYMINNTLTNIHKQACIHTDICTDIVTEQGDRTVEVGGNTLNVWAFYHCTVMLNERTVAMQYSHHAAYCCYVDMRYSHHAALYHHAVFLSCNSVLSCSTLFSFISPVMLPSLGMKVIMISDNTLGN